MPTFVLQNEQNLEKTRLNMRQLDINVISKSPSTACFTDRVAVMTNFAGIAPVRNEPQTLDGMLMGVVISGRNSFTLDKQEYAMGPGDIFACYPRNIIDSYSLSPDIKAVGLFLSSACLDELYDKVNIDWNMRLMAMSHVPLHANPQQTEHIANYIHLLEGKMKEKVGPFRHDCLQTLLLSLAYYIFDIRMQSSVNVERPSMHYTSAERIFNEFIQMLNAPDRRLLNVNGYAEALQITPKYFSTICRQLTGKTAGQIINEEQIRTAKIELHDKDKSIKQISDELGFANQSHFASFFHRHVGESPQRYRAKM